MPDALPRSLGLTALMIAFMFGDAKRPEPPPMSAMYTARTEYGVVLTTVASPSNPTADTSNPAVAR
jgi:hypothetical protein